MLLSPKKTIIYGPVNSRRLGRSLGVNLLPLGQKICTFNCVYCQYGWTDFHMMSDKASTHWPSTEDVCAALVKTLNQLPTLPDYITFSGNGEPTLHPSFPEIVAAVNSVRDRFAPGTRTAILSNSALSVDPKIRKALSHLDRRVMKLDSGNTQTFLRYNQPINGPELEDIINGLKNLDDITVQALFSNGDAGNMAPAHLNAWLEQINHLRPSHVQIYTLDRDAPADKLIPASMSDLQGIKARVKKIGIAADTY